MDELKDIADVLDIYLGDTDPNIDEDWTDEEIKTEYPIFWSCRELFGYLKKQLPSPCTPEQYKEITGKDYPDDCLVWTVYSVRNEKWEAETFKEYCFYQQYKSSAVIVQTGQPAPPSDWRLE